MEENNAIYVVVMGVSGCGKTTIGKLIARGIGNAEFVDGDDLHPPSNIDKMSNGVPLEDSDRWPWLDIICERAQVALKQNRNFVVACSALKLSYRQRLSGNGANARFVYLNGSRELIIKRQSAREDHFMPSSLIASQFDALEVPVGEPNVYSVSVDQDVKIVVDEALQQLRPLLNNG